MISIKDKEKARKTSWRMIYLEQEIYKLVRKRIHRNKKRYDRKNKDNYYDEV